MIDKTQNLKLHHKENCYVDHHVVEQLYNYIAGYMRKVGYER